MSAFINLHKHLSNYSVYRNLRHRLSLTSLREPVVWKRHQGFRPNDVFMNCYPRSGSTWLRFMLAEIISGEPSVSFQKVNRTITGPGLHRNAPPLFAGGARLLHSHEKYRKEYATRAMLVVRDARDVMISEHAYQCALGWFEGDLDAYIMPFLKGEVNAFGPWHEHARSWLDSPLAKRGDLLVIRFEELRKKTDETLQEILKFYGVPIDLQVIRSAVANNGLDRMKEKEKKDPQRASKRGRFVRTGSVGGWRNVLTPAQARLVEQYAGESLARLGYPVGDTVTSDMPVVTGARN